jgi:hypothetical protein
MKPMPERLDHVDLDREVIRRDDGVVVVRETDPETGERIERKYPDCPVETGAKTPGTRR